MTDTAIETLLNKQAITEVLYRYCRAMDRIDREMTLSIWHPDGTCNYSSTEGVADMLFRDYLVGSTKARQGFANHSHQITNILIELADSPGGDRAVSEAYFTASLQTPPSDGKVLEHLWRGRYLDRWSKRAGAWAIDHRQVVFDSYTPYEFDAGRLKGMPLALSRRDRDDPSYGHLAGR
jgi:SnoaL-like domain